MKSVQIADEVEVLPCVTKPPMLEEPGVEPKSSVCSLCLTEVLERQAERIPDAPAILAPGRAPLTYARLFQEVETIGRVLRRMGIGPHDRVAVVLPNGPEMAVTILGVACSAASSPINPAYSHEELDRYFADLRPRVLITQAEFASAASRVAHAHDIRILELPATREPEAGAFSLEAVQACEPGEETNRPDDVALLLFTSGTTSRPKIVPLTHANICTSAHSSAAALALRESDRCLNMLPLFHGHGLIATVLASLAAGASVVCTSGCETDKFLPWLTTFRPTWYSAVPTMHAAILAQARKNPARAAAARLRFIRSASAPLSPRVFAELEQTFETPVIEFYGMTETASSPIACNPLPPGRRKPGSVGRPVHLDVAIVDEEGTLVPNGEPGQVLVRGASVTSGYDGDPQSGEAAFMGDWFKTGDRGCFDPDGYLFLSGRKQDIINRGGEKIAPREVEEVLEQHPAVTEAVTFAVPHATLGQDVISAVVLRPDVAATPQGIRQFAVARIADFKVPREVIILSELPKSATGKIQRAALASKLGLAATASNFVPPRTDVERMLARCWAEALEREQVGIHDNFFALGGDSLSAIGVLTRIHEITGLELEASCLFERPTVAEMARYLEPRIEAGPQGRSAAIPRMSRDNGVPASITQERLWKLQHALEGFPFFNVLYGIRLKPPLDIAALECSIQAVVERHEMLRTSFAVVNGDLTQVIASHATVPLIFDDLTASGNSKRCESIAQNLIEQEALHSFDLAHAPLLRTRLLHMADGEYLLLIATHQIVADGWSLGVLVDDLAAFYDAFSKQQSPALAPLPIQFADFADWQRQWRSERRIATQLEYWRDQLRPPLPVVRLGKAAARKRSALDDLHTARRSFSLPAGLAEAAKHFAHREGGTLFMALAAALKTLLHRSIGQDDLLLATNVANRNRPGTEGLIGPLANTVILRTNLGGDPSSREVLGRVRATTLAAFGQQDVPFEELARTLRDGHASTPAGLAQFMLLLDNATLRPVASRKHQLRYEEAAPGLLLPLVTATNVEIMLMLRETENELVGTCVYKPQLFDAKAIGRLLRQFQRVLEQVIADPERPISAIRLA